MQHIKIKNWTELFLCTLFYNIFVTQWLQSVSSAANIGENSLPDQFSFLYFLLLSKMIMCVKEKSFYNLKQFYLNSLQFLQFKLFY
jgi:hypothetical protein